MEGDSQAEPVPGQRKRKEGPSSTLAATFEELNLKKPDVAPLVDPLFHKTSAQFDAGGAKGGVSATVKAERFVRT